MYIYNITCYYNVIILTNMLLDVYVYDIMKTEKQIT